MTLGLLVVHVVCTVTETKTHLHLVQHICYSHALSCCCLHMLTNCVLGSLHDWNEVNNKY